MDSFLSQHPAFRRLSPEALAELEHVLKLKEYGKGELVFEEGDPPEAVYLLRSGLAKAVKYSPQAEPFAMEIIAPGELFGMIAVLDKKAYPVSVVTLKSSAVYRIPASVFEQLLRRHPDLSSGVYAMLGSHVRQAQTLRSLFKAPVERRIACVLSILAESVGSSLDVRRGEIAELAGCTQETAIRALIGLKDKKLIGLGWKRISILELDGLKALAERE